MWDPLEKLLLLVLLLHEARTTCLLAILAILVGERYFWEERALLAIMTLEHPRIPRNETWRGEELLP
jgi:hypothetical protein